MTFMLAQPSVVKLLMEEAKSQAYDTIIIGESHAAYGYNPFIISDKIGHEVFNISRGRIIIPNLSYILEEINVLGQYKKVILDLDESYFEESNKGNNGTDTNLLLKLSGERRLRYFKDILLKENYNDILADYTVNSTTIKNIPRNVECKLSKSNYIGGESAIQSVYSVIENESYRYEGRGFLRGIKKSDNKYESKQFDTDNINAENLEAFKKIVQYCKNNNIELVCAQSALPPYRLLNENMDEVHEYFAELCDKYDVPFYDLNYLKDEYLSRTDDDYIDLEGHMMGELADRQSTVLGQILVSENKDAFFYDNYNDVLTHLNTKKEGVSQ